MARSRGQRAADRIAGEIENAMEGVIDRAIREGTTPFDAARVLAQMIGMTESGTQAALNYRAAVINLGSYPTTLENAFERYVNQRMRARTADLAQYEAQGALQEGETLEWLAAMADGRIPRGAKELWVAQPDACDACADLDGETGPVGGDFDGEGRPPKHKHCQCEIVLVWPNESTVPEVRQRGRKR